MLLGTMSARMTTRDMPATRAAVITGLLLLTVYVCTAAPSLTFWDASEFATAIGTLGIPHPPGTPLYVALGSALWRLVPGLSPVQAGTLLSALATAGACAIAAALVARVSGRCALGVICGLCAGAMGTIWNNATETEVYAVSLFSVALQLALAWHAQASDDDRPRILLAYVAALSVPLHLSALVATPAAMLLANTDVQGRVRWPALGGSGALVLATVMLSKGQLLVSLCCLGAAVFVGSPRGMRMAHVTGAAPWLRNAAVLTLVAWSAVCIMLLRARLSPYLNQGDPDTLASLLQVMSRAQYDVAPLWPRRAPLWLQVGNIAQYADWQVALGAWNDVTPSLWRTPFTMLAVLLGAAGGVRHWRAHRISARVMLVLLVLSTLGVCVQLNLRAGPSYGIGVLAQGALHEARERDYFFALGFWCWGLWIGAGAWAVAQRVRRPVLFASFVPLLMILGNWTAVSRAPQPDRSLAMAIADEFLHDVPPHGLLLTAGDNDSYPLWYRQAVDSIRPDVQVVVTSLLPANWYLRETARRARLNADTTVRATVQARAGQIAAQQIGRRGALAVSILLDADIRNTIGRAAGVTCWRRVGLVDIGLRSARCPPRVDMERSMASSQRLEPLRRPVARQSPDGMVAAFQRVARCPAAAVDVALTGRMPADLARRALLDIACNLR